MVGKQTSFRDAFRICDDVLRQAVQGISDLITVPGLINLDFADVQTIMSDMGMALLGTGVASGENRAVEAAQKAISSPLLEESSFEHARGVLINITGGPDLTLFEVNEASSIVKEVAHEDAHIIFGSAIDETMQGELRVTVIATGFECRDDNRAPIPLPIPEKSNVALLHTEPHHTSNARTAAVPHRAAVGERYPLRLHATTHDERDLNVPTLIRRRSESV